MLLMEKPIRFLPGAVCFHRFLYGEIVTEAVRDFG